MKSILNLIIWTLIFLIICFWTYKLENDSSELDRLKQAIDTQSVWIQEDTNRVKIHYQLQFLYAPDVLEVKLPKEKPYEVHYKRNNKWNVLHFKTGDK